MSRTFSTTMIAKLWSSASNSHSTTTDFHSGFEFTAFYSKLQQTVLTVHTKAAIINKIVASSSFKKMHFISFFSLNIQFVHLFVGELCPPLLFKKMVCANTTK